jgi:RecA-family ATPase
MYPSRSMAMASTISSTRETIVVRYQHGLFLPVPGVGSLEKAAQDQRDNDLFLTMLDQFEAQGRYVSDKVNANNYAPAMFSKANGLAKARFADAMQRLFTANKIRVVSYGKPSRQYFKITRPE